MASQPQQLPPGISAGTTGAAGAAEPRPLTEEIALAGGAGSQATVAAAAAAAPTLTPPPGAGVGVQAGAGAAGGVSVWQPNATVTSLWSINQDRNSWVGFSGKGWVKLSTASDTGIIAMTILVSHAMITQTQVGYRTEADGMLHEMYVW